MKYFTTNQHGNPIIVELNKLPKWQSSMYTPLSDFQLTFAQDNPTATPIEIMQCGMNTAPQVVTVDITLDEYKEIAKLGISDLSLSTSRKFITEYQFLNAQSSLLVADGDGIYSHEQAKSYISNYNTVGKQCRDKYYTFLAKLNECSTIDSAKTLVDATTRWYEEYEQKRV